MDLDQMVAEHPDMFRGLYRLGEPRRSTPSISYQVEPLKVMRRDIPPLIERHYQEIAAFKEIQKLDPDWEAYEALERSGRLWVLTIRNHGDLIGYIVIVVHRSLHYKNILMAMEDIHYLLPEFRKGLTGYRMLVKAKQAMKERGVKLMTLRTKFGGHSHAPLFERLGGELQDLVYAIVL